MRAGGIFATGWFVIYENKRGSENQPLLRPPLHNLDAGKIVIALTQLVRHIRHEKQYVVFVIFAFPKLHQQSARRFINVHVIVFINEHHGNRIGFFGNDEKIFVAILVL